MLPVQTNTTRKGSAALAVMGSIVACRDRSCTGGRTRGLCTSAVTGPIVAVARGESRAVNDRDLSLPASLPLDPHTARALLDNASRQLAEVQWRLMNARGRAALLCEEVDWQTPSARAFFAHIELWRDDVVRLWGVADSARDHVGWARSELESLLWRGAA